MMEPTDAVRSRIMRAVKSKDTLPERIVRSALHKLGYRFRLNRADLPGKPDVVLPRFRKAIFIDGCFWHGHNCPRGARIPKTNRIYWISKIASNKSRDRRKRSALSALGWKPMVIWECQCQNAAELSRFLRGVRK